MGSTTPCVSPGNPLPATFVNPCSVEAILAQKFFFPYPADVTQFIHCDVWGKAWVRPCPQGEQWDQNELTCIVPSSIANPCHNISAGDPLLYTYPCDPTKYIQCDLWHESYTRACNPANYYFYQSSQACVPPNSFVPTTPPPGTCDNVNPIANPAVSQQPITAQPSTVQPVINTPSSHGEYGYCGNCPPYTEPCNLNHIIHSKLFFPVYGDRHHYIQCDLTGHMYLQTCTNNGQDFFNPVTNTCVDGSLAVDNLVG